MANGVRKYGVCDVGVDFFPLNINAELEHFYLGLLGIFGDAVCSICNSLSTIVQNVSFAGGGFCCGENRRDLTPERKKPVDLGIQHVIEGSFITRDLI